MMRHFLMFGLLAAVGPMAQGQAPVIRSADMFNEVGLYYRAYANNPASTFTVVNQIGSAGPGNFWDFSTGPTDQVHRYDYLSATSVPEASDFPTATVVERKTVEGGGDTDWLMFEQVPGVGRRVHGVVSEVQLLGLQPLVFSPPPIDFPDTINYGDSWNNDFSWEILEVIGIDPEDQTTNSFGIRQIYTVKFTADAWGIAALPSLGLLEVLRVNGEQAIASDFWDDTDKRWVPVVTDYSRVYYWLSPGHGIVAQLQSATYTSAAPEVFDRGIGFVRMFETNKEPGSPNTDPQPVTGLKVTVSNGIVLIQWNKAANASAYRVEYSAGSLASGDWQQLGTDTQNEFMVDPAGLSGGAGFYRVVSMP
jgi:hypothetical protein